MRDLRGLGGRNALAARPRGSVTGRRRLAAAEAAYERLRDADGRLPATLRGRLRPGLVSGRDAAGAQPPRRGVVPLDEPAPALSGRGAPVESRPGRRKSLQALRVAVRLRPEPPPDAAATQAGDSRGARPASHPQPTAPLAADAAERRRRIELLPNCSLTPRQARLFFATVAVTSLSIAGFFVASGFWPVLPFAGLELALLGWALAGEPEAPPCVQTVEIDETRITMTTRGPGGVNEQIQFSRHWAKVKLRAPKAGSRAGC